MTREQFAQKIRWPFIFWLAGIVNVGAMLPQLIQIIMTWQTEDLSLTTVVIYFGVQIAFTLEGFFKRNTTLMVCLGLSAAVSLTIILLVLYIRYVH